MYDVIIIHGSFGSPYENWFPWLYQQLKNDGKKVLVPHFPTPEEQSLDTWMKVLDSYDDLIGEKTTFIAHSIAPAFVVDYLIKNKKKVKGFISVAPFYGLIDIKEFDDINSTFFIKDINLKDVQSYTDYVHCFYSDDDPYVPIRLSENFVKETNATKLVINNGKHLNTSSGFTTFQQILDIFNSK
jgi:hypothetical protein